MSAPPPTATAPQARPLAALLLIFSLVYLGSLFSPALLDDADSTHAEAAREMAASGDLVTLRVNGVRYLEKAPLMYWLVAASVRVFGATAAAVRLPIALAVLLLAALAWRWAGRAFGAIAGLYAPLFLLTSAGVFLFTRILIPEVLLSLLIGASLYFFLSALHADGQTARWRWYLGYAATALAVLTKGLVALVFIGGTAALFLAISGEWRRWRQFRLVSGLALFLLIAAPWHLLAGWRNPGFFWFYFVNEHFLRFLGRRWPQDYNKLPGWLYWALHLAWLFPWSFFLPAAVRDLWRFRGQRGHDFTTHTRLLCWIWAGLVLVFFALSTNQEYYTFPVYLPLILLIAGALARQEQDAAANRELIASHAALALIGAFAAAVLLSGLWSSRSLPPPADIGTAMAERGVGDYTLSMSHFFDLTGAALAALRLPALLAACGLLVGPLLALILRWRRRAQSATWALVVAMSVVLFAAHLALARFEPYLSSKPLADATARHAQPADLVAIYGDQAFGSSLLFYLQRPVLLVNGRTTSMEFGSRFPDAPRIFLDDQQLKQLWATNARIFLFVPRERRSDVERLQLEPRVIVGELSGKTVWTNRD